MAKFVTIDRDTPMLLPPDMRDWIPSNHLVHFVIDAIEAVDTSCAQVNHRGTGNEQYPPTMLLALLVYSYCVGMFSSRQIERPSHTDVAVRLLCANTHPDHDTICAFRRKNGALLHSAFAQILEMAGRCGVLKVGQVTVAIDGTKILANASKHAAVSYGYAEKRIEELDLEIKQLLEKAEQADSTPLQEGLTIPAEVQRREERQAAQEAGKKLPVRVPQAPTATPGEKDQVNFTDEESRIMKTKDGFQQCYNAQAAVETNSRLIVGNRVSQAPNDKQELVPDMKVVLEHVVPENVLIDSGFVSKEAIETVEKETPGLTVIAAMKREPHGRTVAQLEQREDPQPPPSTATFGQRMSQRTATADGRALYKLRQQTVEPVFGIIKEAIGFRRFSLRGHEKASLEWNLVCLSYDIKRLHIMGAKLTKA